MRPNERIPNNLIIVSITLLIMIAGSAAEANNQFSSVPYITIATGDGEPAYDLSKIDVRGWYLINLDSYLTMALNYTKYDFEGAYKLLGMDSTGENDIKAASVTIGANVEREFSLYSILKPQVGPGVGVAFISTDDIVGLSRGWRLFY